MFPDDFKAQEDTKKSSIKKTIKMLDKNFQSYILNETQIKTLLKWVPARFQDSKLKNIFYTGIVLIAYYFFSFLFFSFLPFLFRMDLILEPFFQELIK